jgi:hypothetical protein
MIKSRFEFATSLTTPNLSDIDNMEKGSFAEHMYAFDCTYKIDTVRNWLFEQK